MSQMQWRRGLVYISLCNSGLVSLSVLWPHAMRAGFEDEVSMIDGQPDGAAREASLWARIWAWWKAWRRPRKHFFVNTRVTIFFGLIFMLDIRLIVALLILAATLDSYTFLAGQDRAKGEAEIPFWLSLKPVYFTWFTLAIAIPFAAPVFRDACLPSDSVWVSMFGLASWKINEVGGLCAYPYSSYMFFVELGMHMNLILSFFYMNYVVQRNCESVFFLQNRKRLVSGLNKVGENKFIPNAFWLVAIFVLLATTRYGGPDGFSRMPAPYLHLADMIRYIFLFHGLTLFLIVVYFITYARWRSR